MGGGGNGSEVGSVCISFSIGIRVCGVIFFFLFFLLSFSLLLLFCCCCCCWVVNDVLSKFVVSHPRDFFFSSLSLSLDRSFALLRSLSPPTKKSAWFRPGPCPPNKSKCARAECLNRKKKNVLKTKKNKNVRHTQKKTLRVFQTPPPPKYIY